MQFTQVLTGKRLGDTNVCLNDRKMFIGYIIVKYYKVAIQMSTMTMLITVMNNEKK